jgi:hypothetical protein
MGSNEVNKIAGALLGMATLAMGIGFLSRSCQPEAGQEGRIRVAG